jgi:signal transduction histidine kinase/CheY-like chemotaxis protein
MRVFGSHETGVRTMCWSAGQDHSGVMYFGCDSVVSFDGDRWRAADMGATYAVRGLDVGPNGRVWAAGVNEIGWFEAGPEGNLAYHSLMPRLAPGTPGLGDVWRVYADGDDSAVFVTHGRVLRWDGSRFTAWDFPGVHMLFSTRTQKSVYVHYRPVGLLRLGGDGPAVAVPASVIGTADIRWLDDSSDPWLVLTSDGFYSLHDGTYKALDTDASRFALANTPTSAVRLRDGSLAIGTLLGGIAVVDRSGDILRVFNRRSGLPDNQIYSLFEDRDGALWAMGPSHIVRLGVASGVSVYGPPSGYPPGGIISLAEFGDSTYVASHSDILRLAPGSGGAFSSLGVSSSRFYSLLSAPEGLVISHVRGLGIWSPAGMRALMNSDIIFQTGLSRARPGEVLASQDDRVFSVNLRTGRSTVVADRLPEYGNSLVDEPSGRLWIGTQSRGLFFAGPGSVHAAGASPRFGAIPAAGPILVSRAGATVVALARGAAYFLDPASGRFRPVAGVPEGNPAVISDSDSKGGVWAALDPAMGENSPRLGRISLTSTGAAWTPRSIEGLPEIGSISGLLSVATPEGDALCISGSESLIRAGPAALGPRPPPRRPTVSASFLAGNGGAPRAVEGVLPYSTRRLHIEFSSLDYGMRESEKFQTMLGGAETEWSQPTDAAEREFPVLRDGTYDFRVRLITDSGESGEAAVLHFEISPPWWRTPLAYGAFGLAGASAIFGLVRLRLSSIRRRTEMLEEMVRQRTDELEKANAAKTEFVASMSHEIRNPMNGILGSALELSESQLGPEQREAVSTLRSCATFLASLVEDVLDFAAIEAGAYKVVRSPFSPRETLDAVLKMLAPRSGDARFSVNVDPGLPGQILGDAARVQQVIVNFVVNSLKFGGGEIELSARAEGGSIVFSVADNGPGIPLDEQKNLFIRFSRLKSARNSAIPGTGLGLAASRALAERMGGSVGVESAPGRGSRFHLSIPIEVASGAAPGSAGFHAEGGRALVVEDIGYNARSLALMLGRLGFDVEIAVDGEEAVARLAEGPYSAVFIDCDLPKMSGIEVARILRGSEEGARRTLVVATTAHSTVEDERACLAAGMDVFLAKPITPEKLRRVLSGSAVHGPAAPQPDPVARGPDRDEGIELGLIRGLSDGSAEGLRREAASFIASLDEAMDGVSAAHESCSRAALSSAAHRVISHARMVGASALAQTAADLQEFAASYTEAELAQELLTLRQRAEALKAAVARLLGPLEEAALGDAGKAR